MIRLNDAQNEIAKLRRSLDTTQQEKIHRDKEMMDAQEKFSSTLKTLQAENERVGGYTTPFVPLGPSLDQGLIS